MAKSVIYIVAIVILLAVLVGGGVLVWQKFFASGSESTAYTSIQAIKMIAQLATVEYDLEHFHFEKAEPHWYEWLDTKYFVVLTVKVIGAVDLDNSDIIIDEENKSVQIKFRRNAIIIHDPEISPDNIKLFTCSDPNVFHKIKAEDWEKAENAALAEINDAVLKSGIKVRTAMEAKHILTSFVSSLGYEAKIEFEDEAIDSLIQEVG